jgi:hypothetical protein
MEHHERQHGHFVPEFFLKFRPGPADTHRPGL